MATGVTVGVVPSGLYGVGNKVYGPIGVNDPYTEAALFVVNVNSTQSGAGALIVKIQGYDWTSQTGFDILTSSFLSAAGQTVLRVGPQYTAAANIAKDYMPSNFQVITTVSGASVNYSIGAEFI